MMRIDFYHLTAAPLEKVLPSICEKLLAAGERLLVVAEEDRVPALDRQLWSYAPESFLPHAQASGTGDELQPILISSDVAPGAGIANVALADGKWRQEALAFERIFYFFDSASIEDARASWRTLKDRDGAELRYWKQDPNGRWVEGP
jgi:DNA polymerase-3 subunit chi